MTERAPESPTTSELLQRHLLQPEQRARLMQERERMSHLMGGTGLLATIGPCAMTEDEETMRREAQVLAQMGMIHRKPPYKPRTRKEDWHGLESTDPERAFRIITEHANDTANTAVEIGADPRHLPRYADRITMAWKGGRNDEQPQLTEALALHDPTLPVAIKNGLDGNLEKALTDVETIELLRRGMGARAILLFRGGLNAQTPETWEEQYLLAHDLTNGRFLVDWAHGGEQAHDPNGKFGKSVEGQIACMEHTIDIVQRTHKAPAGIFAEASDAISPTDPVMPFNTAVDGALRLANIKQSLPV